MAGDFDYKKGLKQLKVLLQRQAPSYLDKFHTLDARLLENIQDEQSYGSNEMRRSDRAQIVATLNNLTSRAKLRVSFNDLCMEEDAAGVIVRDEKEAVASPMPPVVIEHADHVTVGDGTRITHQEIRASEGSTISHVAQAAGSDATVVAGERQVVEPETVASLRRQLAEARKNLRLIEERKAEYVLSTDVPLQLIKGEQQLRARIAELMVQLVAAEEETVAIETILIRAGDFLMGSDPYDQEAHDNEKPQHKVTLPAYEIGKYSVTNAQYWVFVRAIGHPTPVHWSYGQVPSGKENHPVVNVSLEDARVFCGWLTETTGWLCRLPTEAEWEKAARGSLPDRRRYPWGDEWVDGAANTKEASYNDTTPVDAFDEKNRSLFGVIDMAGNVLEWTDSEYKPFSYSAYETMIGGTRYVVRGGCFTLPWYNARVTWRGRYTPDTVRPYLGFRVAVEVESGEA